uniref:Uncharacterized protein n=1 Tax=Amazona collaria TaxID=241587 RepID=A0A8B9G4L6_9PSIT
SHYCQTLTNKADVKYKAEPRWSMWKIKLHLGFYSLTCSKVWQTFHFGQPIGQGLSSALFQVLPEHDKIKK